ncbi:uncharacterized protein MKZ38_010699 [Zalerion maritima]|uniref:Mtf2-like C-terminal domain-containing protein n=1 Tax=Zalerion maritima TaxID=339359 RepID=A0AAD5WUC2_9PEZI|nr:uncharacterized protein MKZ38_010699 [Zalerion maritima]
MTSTTLLPFLYQTQTLVRAAGRPSSVRRWAKAAGDSVRPSHPGSRRYVSAKKDYYNRKSREPVDDIPFEYTQHTPAPPKLSGRDLKTTTLTPTERQAFEAIFADIEQRGIRPVVPFTEETEDDQEIRFEGEAIPDEDGPDTTHSLRAILDHASEAFDSRNSASFDALSPLRTMQSPSTDRGKLVMKYPSALRSTAHKALHFLDQDPVGKTAIKNPSGSVQGEMERTAAFERALQLEELRREERSKVEVLMKEASSDVDLWNVMEKEVFSMIGKMKLDDQEVQGQLMVDATKGDPFAAESPSSPSSSSSSSSVTLMGKSGTKKKRSKRKTKDKLVEMAGTEDGGNSRAGAMSIRVHGPLYPSYILLGLKLLDTHFARSSPLALTILPRVKELGLASYVLGVSTPFYNHLIQIYWSRYGDAGGVLNLLEEMRTTGHFFDETTLNLLHHISLRLKGYAERSDKPMKRADFGFEVDAFARRIAHMPEYDSFIVERIGYWIAQVHRSIEERQQTLGF